MKRILVFLSSESNAMRECIIGILKYVNGAARSWDVSLIPDPLGVTPTGLTPARIAKAIDEGVDGVITGVYQNTPGFQALVASGLPTVLNAYPPDWQLNRKLPITCVHNNDLSIGRLAAKYFHDRGNFPCYAFIPDRRKCAWSTYRRRGFELELFKDDIRPVSFNAKAAKLDDWLLRLPKPAAIFAVNDNTAINIITTCQRLGLNIPSQVSIVGVDNDELYCSSIRPSLTSIHPNHVEQGRRAASELAQLMNTRQSNGMIYIPPKRLVERKSTRAIPPAGHLINWGLSYINKHYHEGISAADVAKHLGVSGQLLRLRFKTIYGRSVREIILEKRLLAAKRLLSKSDAPISQIAKRTGFGSSCRFTHYFRQKTKKSPQAWRRDSQLGPANAL